MVVFFFSRARVLSVRMSSFVHARSFTTFFAILISESNRWKQTVPPNVNYDTNIPSKPLSVDNQPVPSSWMSMHETQRAPPQGTFSAQRAKAGFGRFTSFDLCAPTSARPLNPNKRKYQASSVASAVGHEPTLRRGRACEYAVNLGGHDEVVLMQSLDLLGLQRDGRVAPTEAEILMMSFSFREFTNLLNKGERLPEIAKPEAPLDAVSFLQQLPVRGLRMKELSLLAREWRYSPATGRTGFASKSLGHVACPRVKRPPH